MKASAQTLRISPKKISVIAGMVRNKKATEALALLKFTPKKAAKLLHKIVQSAVSNAENNFKQDVDTLYIKEVLVMKGMSMKRGVPTSRGRTLPIVKRNSHVMVKLGVKDMEMPVKKGKKSEVKEIKNEEIQKKEEVKTKPVAKKVAKKTSPKAKKTTV